ncbi:MAG: hypothetical protein ACP5TJ_01810 [Candidatus Micrarchaeia archaeon]
MPKEIKKSIKNSGELNASVLNIIWLEKGYFLEIPEPNSLDVVLSALKEKADERISIQGSQLPIFKATLLASVVNEAFKKFDYENYFFNNYWRNEPVMSSELLQQVCEGDKPIGSVIPVISLDEAIKNGQGVCIQEAVTLYFLLDSYLKGEAHWEFVNGYYSGLPHAWVRAKIGKQVYILDPTKKSALSENEAKKRQYEQGFALLLRKIKQS